MASVKQESISAVLHHNIHIVIFLEYKFFKFISTFQNFVFSHTTMKLALSKHISTILAWFDDRGCSVLLYRCCWFLLPPVVPELLKVILPELKKNLKDTKLWHIWGWGVG